MQFAVLRAYKVWWRTIQDRILRLKKGSLTRDILYGILLLSTISCVWREEVSDDNNTFRYNESGGLYSLDPAQMGYKSAIIVGTQIYNGLVEFDTAMQIVPALASSWETNDDGTRWTFHLRKDVFFHENECFGEQKKRQVNAYDVEFSLRRIVDARTRSTGAWTLRDKLRGGVHFFERTKAGETPELEGISVPDSFTVVLKLEKQYAPLLSILAMPYCFIVAPEAVSMYGEDFFKNPVGTGAFRFVQWEEDKSLILEKNSDYFEYDSQGEQLPYLRKVEVSFVRDTKTAFLEFRQGKYDALMSIDAAFLPLVRSLRNSHKNSAHFVLSEAPAFTIEYYGVMLDSSNETSKSVPFSQKRKIRQALNYAIDREKIVEYVLLGKGTPAHQGVLPPGIPCFERQREGYRYDKNKALQLLAEAGYPKGKGLPPFVLQIGLQQASASVAEAIQQMWAEIGVQVSIKQVDFPQHLSMIRAGKLPIWRTSWIGDYPDPENFLSLFYSPYRAPAGPNTTHFVSSRFDSLFERALETNLSNEQRCELYAEMEDIVIEEAPWIFLYYEVVQRLIQPNIANFHTDGSDRLLIKYIRKFDSNTLNS